MRDARSRIERSLLPYVPPQTASDRAGVLEAILAGCNPEEPGEGVVQAVAQALERCDEYDAVMEGALDMAVNAVLLAWKEGTRED